MRDGEGHLCMLCVNVGKNKGLCKGKECHYRKDGE